MDINVFCLNLETKIIFWVSKFCVCHWPNCQKKIRAILAWEGRSCYCNVAVANLEAILIRRRHRPEGTFHSRVSGRFIPAFAKNVSPKPPNWIWNLNYVVLGRSGHHGHASFTMIDTSNRVAWQRWTDVKYKVTIILVTFSAGLLLWNSVNDNRTV